MRPKSRSMLIFVSRAVKKVVRGLRQGFLEKYARPIGKEEDFFKNPRGLDLADGNARITFALDTKSTEILGSMRFYKTGRRLQGKKMSKTSVRKKLDE